jgi:3-deoxy-7-phosphoheptulonate synthase
MSKKPGPMAFKRTFGAAVNIPRILENNFIKPKDMIVLGGPCSVESPEQVDKIIPEIADDVTFFRGGVFRAGHYPYSKEGFGLKLDLLKYYHQKAKEYRKPNIVEILDYRQIEMIDPYADAFQIGTRAAQNYVLLTELAKQSKPVFLKRGMWQKLDEWLGSLEYLVKDGKNNVYLIERGTVGIDNHTRWCLGLSSIPAINEICDVPVIVDACHSSGRRDLVPALSLAGIACGAAGVLLETHPDPDKSLSDAEQTIDFETFHKTVKKCKEIYNIVGKKD